MAGDDQNDEVARLKARIAELENSNRNGLGSVGFSRGFFGCFGVAGAIVVVIVAVFAMGQCSHRSSNSATDTASSPSYNPEGEKKAVGSTNTEPTWTYSETTDQLTGKVTKTACTTSINQVNLDPPYEPVTANFCIRKSPKFGLDTYIALNGSGQILCSSYEGCAVRASFDKGAIKSFSGAEAADHSSNIVFITGSNRLIAELKKSKSAVFELKFFQSGVQDLSFKTEGLKWP